MIRLEQLLDELVSAAFEDGIAYADSDGGSIIHTTDVDDARKEVVEHFKSMHERHTRVEELEAECQRLRDAISEITPPPILEET